MNAELRRNAKKKKKEFKKDFFKLIKKKKKDFKKDFFKLINNAENLWKM